MKVCFFDIDGTLIASGGAGQRAFARVFRERFGVDQISKAIGFAGRSDRAIALDLMAAHDIEPSDENWHAFQDDYLKALPISLAECEGCVLPGVEATIARFAQTDGIGMGLLTGNVVRGAQAKLTHYNLWHHFAFGGYGDHHSSRDDIARSAVVAAGEYLKCSPNGDSKFAVIGDTVHDITCARAIGAFAVAVPTGFTSMDELRAAKPDLAIETLEDVDALFEWFDS